MAERDAIIDKLVGDEVMGLFLTSFPTLARGPQGCGVMVRSARDLLARLDPLPVGVGLHYGVARVGNVGDGAVKDFTAVGVVVNTASRLQACAGPGEIVMSDAVFERVSEGYADARPVSLTLKGKSEPIAAHVL
jgi:adenylate cyclase